MCQKFLIRVCYNVCMKIIIVLMLSLIGLFKPILYVNADTGVYAQIIDDVNGKTLVTASTLDKEIKTKACNIAAATEVGTLVAKRATKAGIKSVVFDRGGYNYHGRVKALAEAAREGGLEF